MNRRKSSDFDQELLDLFDQYVHGAIDRRGFLDSAARFAAGGVSAAMLLEMLSPRFAQAQQVAKDDRRLQAQRLEFASPRGHEKAKGYLVRPAGAAGKLPAVLVAHENRGLNPHIEDIARRLALEGYMAFAPDALAPLGGYPGNEDDARKLFATLDETKVREDFLAATSLLLARADGTGKVGAVGFCWGGEVVNFLATRVAQLAAAVPFYGPAPKPEDVAAIKSPLLIHYAEKDPRVNASWPGYEAALKAGGVKHTMHMYPGTQHGFNNDTTPRFDEAAAKLAWQRTLDFFGQHLRG